MTDARVHLRVLRHYVGVRLDAVWFYRRDAATGFDAGNRMARVFGHSVQSRSCFSEVRVWPRRFSLAGFERLALLQTVAEQELS